MAVRHAFQRGDVISVRFPFSDASGRKLRPAVVLSTAGYHDDWDEILVAGLTSRTPRAQRPTDYLLQDWQAAGLPQPSWARSHLATVHRNLVIAKLGQLTARDLQAIEHIVRLATGL